MSTAEQVAKLQAEVDQLQGQLPSSDSHSVDMMSNDDQSGTTRSLLMLYFTFLQNSLF